MLQTTVTEQRVQRRISQLLVAVDGALAATRAVERARDALTREVSRLQNIRVVGQPTEDEAADA
jgi:hypothetical protein